MKGTKVIFLDIDGVLNSCDDICSRSVLWRKDNSVKSRDEFGQLFDERCVRWLRHIIEETGCKIVVSSTWRKSGLIQMQLMWDKRDLPGEVIGVTPVYVDPELLEKYYHPTADRGYEIQQWIEDHNPLKYCIIDDDDDMLPHQSFVQTDCNTGLTLKTSKAVIAALIDQRL